MREAPLERLDELLKRVRRVALFSPAELAELPRLYRYASSLLAREQTRGAEPARLADLRKLVARAHGLLYRDLDASHVSLPRRIARFLWEDSPRAIRAEWRLLAASLLAFYGLAAIAFFAVSADLELAFSLFDERGVSQEISQLRATERGEPFRGNFTFEESASSSTAGMIIANNIWVTILFFGSALVPPIYVIVLVTNALMLGTYFGVAYHWNQAGNIASILFCHGVIELEMIVLAGMAGLVVVRGAIAPGPWSRRQALQREAAQAWRLFAPVAPLLVVAGTIEGFISPHISLAGRLTIAAGTGVALIAWVCLGGRTVSRPAAALVEPGGQ